MFLKQDVILESLGCSQILIPNSEILFIGKTLMLRFDVEKKDIEKILTATIPVIEYAQTNIPFSSEDKKAKLYDLMLNARCIVTETQIAYYREKTSKKPPMPMSFPPSINIESSEEE